MFRIDRLSRNVLMLPKPHAYLTRTLHRSYTDLTPTLHMPCTDLTRAFHRPYWPSTGTLHRPSTGLAQTLHMRAFHRPYEYLAPTFDGPCTDLTHACLPQTFQIPYTHLTWFDVTSIRPQSSLNLPNMSSAMNPSANSASRRIRHQQSAEIDDFLANRLLTVDTGSGKWDEKTFEPVVLWRPAEATHRCQWEQGRT